MLLFGLPRCLMGRTRCISALAIQAIQHAHHAPHPVSVFSFYLSLLSYTTASHDDAVGRIDVKSCRFRPSTTIQQRSELPFFALSGVFYSLVKGQRTRGELGAGRILYWYTPTLSPPPTEHQPRHTTWGGEIGNCGLRTSVIPCRDMKLPNFPDGNGL